jgi:hypothetical protein
MFETLIGFNRGILSMPIPWQIWMVFLVTANLVLPFFFLGTPEAIVVLVAAGTGLVIMMILFAKMGYVKLLGVGHIPWLWSRLDQAVGSGPFYYWLLSVIVLDSLSLVIDTVDVIRYWQGERQSTITA